MNNRCPKCKQKLQSTDFICPNCGHILGQAVADPAKEQNEVRRKERKFPWGILLGILLLALLAVVFIIMGSSDPKPTTAPTEPTATQTTAPLVTYQVQAKNSANRGMGGVHIHVYKGEELLFTFEADKYGKATFILPESDEYYVMLSNLPAPYHITHKDAKFPFENGQRELVVKLEKLEKLDVAYTVKVIDETGTPIEGVLVDFGREKLLTDAQGLCTHYRTYQYDGMNPKVLYAPTGYYLEPDLVIFHDGTDVVEVVLKRIEDIQQNTDQQVYTVSVIDEYGKPVVGQRIGITHNDDFNAMDHSFYTNCDGVATIVDGVNSSFSMGILHLPDYYGVLYTFEPGSNHLQIQLELYKTEFIYTIQFINQASEPVPGVTVKVYTADFSWQAAYTSDENGVISFVCGEAQPMNLFIYVTDAPEDYPMDPATRIVYYFVESRSKVITLLRQTVMTLMDDHGKPIAGAEVHLQSLDNSVRSQKGVTDEKGQCIFVLPENSEFSVSVVSVPEGYGHLLFPTVQINSSQFEIIIEPFEP